MGVRGEIGALIQEAGRKAARRGDCCRLCAVNRIGRTRENGVLRSLACEAHELPRCFEFAIFRTQALELESEGASRNGSELAANGGAQRAADERAERAAGEWYRSFGRALQHATERVENRSRNDFLHDV